MPFTKVFTSFDVALQIVTWCILFALMYLGMCLKIEIELLSHSLERHMPVSITSHNSCCVSGQKTNVIHLWGGIL